MSSIATDLSLGALGYIDGGLNAIPIPDIVTSYGGVYCGGNQTEMRHYIS